MYMPEAGLRRGVESLVVNAGVRDRSALASLTTFIFVVSQLFYQTFKNMSHVDVRLINDSYDPTGDIKTCVEKCFFLSLTSLDVCRCFLFLRRVSY